MHKNIQRPTVPVSAITLPFMDDARVPPLTVSLSPFSPAPLPSASAVHRLSATFVERSRPKRPAEPSPMAWVSLQGRLVNAEEASSAVTIGGLGGEQAVAWELFSPIQRFLIVAVIGVAVARSQKNRHIWHLKKSLELRDQLLSSMQQKLDNLCELVDNNAEEEHSTAFANDGELVLDETLGSERIRVVDCGCWHCDQHSGLFHELVGSSVKTPLCNEEQEERRMSDLSDWASSVTSAADVDIQLNTLAVEQDIYNLKRDCEEKDTRIKELTTQLNSSEVANSKRVAELEDIVRRKNTTITKLKKDLVVLEQKVVQLSRLHRPSFSACDSNGGHLPKMRDNLVYDMESTTSPSSSDSDSTPVKNAQNFATEVDLIDLNQISASAIDKKSIPAKPLSSSVRVFEQHSKSRSVAPFIEIPTNRKSNAASSSSECQLSARGDLKKSRRRSLSGAKSGTARKSWV